MAIPPTSQSLNTGASTAVATASPTPSKYTQEFFLQNVVQDLSSIETSHNQVISLAFPSDTGKYYMTLGVSNLVRNNLFSLDINPTGSIRLPLPLQLVDNHAVNYEQKELGLPGAAASAAMSALSGQGQSIGNILASIGGTIGKVGLNALSSIIPANEIAQVATGIAPNQFLTVLLKGPQYKKHEFTWKLSPRNDTESENIRKIIALLNESMAPGLAVNGAFFSFPKIFEIKLVPNERVLYKFLPAVIENMTVNYTPSGAPAFYHGTQAPDSVELRLSFLELEFWLSGRGMYEL